MVEPLAIVVARIEERVEAIHERLDDYDVREQVRSLELTRSNQRGIAWAFSGVATIVGVVVGYWKS